MKNQYLLFTAFYENQNLSAGKENLKVYYFRDPLSHPLNTHKSKPNYAFASDRKNLFALW